MPVATIQHSHLSPSVKWEALLLWAEVAVLFTYVITAHHTSTRHWVALTLDWHALCGNIEGWEEYSVVRDRPASPIFSNLVLTCILSTSEAQTCIPIHPHASFHTHFLPAPSPQARHCASLGTRSAPVLKELTRSFWPRKTWILSFSSLSYFLWASALAAYPYEEGVHSGMGHQSMKGPCHAILCCGFTSL